jgi:diguanylate cyclase (GGDEF)-like protein
MVEQSTRDPLTGLWNRRSLDLSLDRARPGDALAIVDLDHFKQVNDRLGHAEGDRLLQAFAAHLQDSVRDRDVVGRLGGEEFVILMPSTDLVEARVALERIRAAWPQAAPVPVTFSAGLVNVDHVSEDVRTAGRTALRRADEALYRAKDEGRDRIAWTS